MRQRDSINNLKESKELNVGKSINDLTIDELKVAKLTDKQVLKRTVI